MTFRNCATSALIAVAVLGATACKDDEGGTSGAGGARGLESEVQSEIDALKDQIEALQELLDAESGDVDTIEDALEAAQDRLEELLVCGNGGDCEARTETIEALTSVTDAYCDYLFGCCTGEEVAGALGYSFSDVDACKSVYTNLVTRGADQSFAHNGSSSADDVTYAIQSLLSRTGTLTVQLERGALSLDTDRVEACAEEIAGLSCADDNSSSCRSTESACEGLFVGQQAEGEPCKESAECGDGLICDVDTNSFAEGYGSTLTIFDGGNCIAQAKVDDPCRNDADCLTSDNSLFCSESDKTCQEKVEAGGDCVFLDPNLVNLDLEAPCVDGYSCSIITNTCIADCEEDSTCREWYDECKDGFTCNVTDGRDDWDDLPYYYGFCDEAKKGGETVTERSECESGQYGWDGSEYVCEGLEGESCQIDDDCASEGCVDLKCAATCNENDECADGEYCEGSQWDDGPCLPIGEVGDSCRNDEGCSDGYCDGGTCIAYVATGGDCQSDRTRSCEPEDYCDFTEGGGAVSGSFNCVARGDEDDSCGADVECLAGLECANGKCLPLTGRAAGDYCQSFDECASYRCSGNVCVNASLEEGDECTVDNPGVSGLQATYDIGLDPCEDGLYCRRNTRANDDLTGVCTKQGKPSSVCDTFVRDYSSSQRQCEGNVACELQDDLGYYVCPVTDSTNRNVCPLSRVEYATGGGKGGGMTVRPN